MVDFDTDNQLIAFEYQSLQPLYATVMVGTPIERNGPQGLSTYTKRRNQAISLLQQR
jgi:hypothetical protein